MLASFPTSVEFNKSISTLKTWYHTVKYLCNFLFFDVRRWLGEIYDGVRVCWNSDEKQLYSFLSVPILPNSYTDIQELEVIWNYLRHSKINCYKFALLLMVKFGIIK